MVFDQLSIHLSLKRLSIYFDLNLRINVHFLMAFTPVGGWAGPELAAISLHEVLMSQRLGWLNLEWQRHQ